MRRLLIGFLIVTGCTSTPATPPPVPPVKAPPADIYNALIKANTHGTNQYSGFYQTFQADVTLINSSVQTALLKQRAAFQGWDQAHYQTEHEKAVQEAGAYTKFFLRFFVPDRDYDDLNKPKTIWKAYLEFNGQRLEGKIKKSPEKLAELQVLYPHFDRFATGYEISFNVPMTTIENGSPKFTLTSSLGTAEFVFAPGK